MAQREEDDLMQAIAASLHEQELREQQQKKMYATYSAPAPAPAPETPKVASLYNQAVCARVAEVFLDRHTLSQLFHM
jgi:hypothetical protein